MSEKEKSGILPYRVEKIKDRYLIVNDFGYWIFLNKDEFSELKKYDFKNNASLKEKLNKNNIIVDRKNINKIFSSYRNLNRFLFQGPSLHIVVPTLRCNQSCVYCHARAPRERGLDMDKKTALHVLDFIFKSKSKAITIEFQGGEPLLNWDIVKFITENANDLNEKFEKLDLRITIVTNLTLMDEEKLDYLIRNRVSICTSLDGPAKVHDKNRNYIGGGGTYKDVVYWVKRIKKAYKESGVRMELNALPTITRYSLHYWKEIVDEYVKHDINPIHLKFLNKLGAARENWDEIGYNAEEFLDFWKKGMDYIIGLNEKGINIAERMAKIMLAKILLKIDPGFTELMSPCGAGRTQILYNYNGDVYTCDEGRMLGNDLFMLGNVKNDSYKDVVRSDKLIGACYASVLDNYCQSCAFKPYCGTCPVMNYVEQGNIIPKITETLRHKIYKAQFGYLFNRIMENGTRKIFEGWVSEWKNKKKAA